MFNRTSKYMVVLGLFIGIYLLTIFNIPIDPATLARFHLSESQVRLLSLTIALPYIAIWAAAFYGFIRFKQYTEIIQNTPDGKPLATIANGLMVLAFSLPVTAISSSLLNYVARTSPDWAPTATILKNYLAIILTLAGFTLIGHGGARLSSVVNKRPSFARKHLVSAAFIVIAGLYIYFIFTNPSRHITDSPTQRATYYLPDWLIVLTIIVPYLYIWYTGIRAASYIKFYQEKVKGHIYKPFIGALSTGIIWVLIASIMLQFFAALNDYVSRLTLQQLLIVVYVLLIFISIGYVKIATGARRLKKIEEV